MTHAQEQKPCLIFSGGGNQQAYDLEKYNRIQFGEEFITLGSSKDPSISEIQLLYSLYNHIEVGNAVPAGIDDLTNDMNVQELRIDYDGKNRQLLIANSKNTPVIIGIFDTNGSLLLSVKVSGETSVPLGNLVPGVYIAVATDGNAKSSLKFITN